MLKGLGAKDEDMPKFVIMADRFNSGNDKIHIPRLQRNA